MGYPCYGTDGIKGEYPDEFLIRGRAFFLLFRILFGLFFLWSGIGSLFFQRIGKFAFVNLLKQIKHIVSAFGKAVNDFIQIAFRIVDGWCELGEACIQLFRIFHLGNDKDDAF